MAAIIDTGTIMANSSAENGSDTDSKPVLIGKIDGINDKVTAAIVLSQEDGVISISEDRSVRFWLRRESGQYWPSICHYLPAIPSCIDFNERTSRLFVGLESGVIAEFTIAEDFNSLTQKREYFTHSSGVNALKFSITCEWLLSAGKDKQFVWQCSETGRRLGAFGIGAWPMCLEFDEAAKYAFIGDYSGNISVLRILDNNCSLVSKLSAHTGSVRALAWDAEKQHLFSGSTDQIIIVWDIGGKKGNAFELNGHQSKICGLQYAVGKKRLFSVSDTGNLVCWEMNVPRKETPEWGSSDTCQKCDNPFFWNVKAQWNRKVVGFRQHHCRLCGSAVCTNCSAHTTRYPKMGYEFEVRICNTCYQSLQNDLATSSSAGDSMKSLATFHGCKHSVSGMHFNEVKARLLTIGTDRVLKIWDVSKLVR